MPEDFKGFGTPPEKKSKRKIPKEDEENLKTRQQFEPDFKPSLKPQTLKQFNKTKA